MPNTKPTPAFPPPPQIHANNIFIHFHTLHRGEEEQQQQLKTEKHRLKRKRERASENGDGVFFIVGYVDVSFAETLLCLPEQDSGSQIPSRSLIIQTVHSN